MKALSVIMAMSLLAGVAAVDAAEPAVATSSSEQVPASARTPKPASKPAKKPVAKSPDPAGPATPAAPPGNVELDTTQITGNRELPRVLYVVPWKRADLGELSGKPTKSLLDEVLAPVDRDVFQRQNRYHDALQPDAAAAGAAATTSATVEPKVER